MSGRKAAGLAVSFGWALWLFAAGTAHAADSASVGAEAAQAEKSQAGAKSGDPVAETEDEQALLERARAYWDLRVAGSIKVYDFYPPDVRARGQLPSEFGGVAYTDYEIERVLTKGERGVVIVRAQQVLTHPAASTRVRGKEFENFLKAHLGDEWVEVDGTWYKKPVYGGLSRFLHSRDAPGSAPAESEIPQDVGREAPGSAGP
jgi:hypothetical protein